MAPIEVPSAQAPVHEVVLTGEAADLTALPVHLQHGLDGAPYISASIDYTVDAGTGWTNVGIRRLMLRGRRETGVDLVSPSDLRALYEASAAAGTPRFRSSNASPTTSVCRPMPRWCWKAISMRAATSRPKAPMGSSSATTAPSSATPYSTSPPSPAGVTPCSRPRRSGGAP